MDASDTEIHKKKYSDLGFLSVKKDYEQKSRVIQNIIKGTIKNCEKILDVGSGNGLVAGHLEKWNSKKITKIDPLGTTEDTIKIDFLKNTFKDKEFDLIIINHVSDYIEDKENLLRQLARVGK